MRAICKYLGEELNCNVIVGKYQKNLTGDNKIVQEKRDLCVRRFQTDLSEAKRRFKGWSWYVEFCGC